MTNEEARKIQKIARSIAVKWHRPELAEDFAQEAVIQQLRWPGIDLEYALINLLRHEYGSSRTPGGRARQMATARAISLDAGVDSEDRDSTLNHELVGDPRPDPRTLGAPRNYAHLFGAGSARSGKKGRPRQDSLLAQVYALRFEEELELKQIAAIFGKSELWAWNMVQRIQKRIMLEDGLEEVKETLEEDPGITQIEIDWITL